MWGVLATHVLQTLYQLHVPTFDLGTQGRMLLMNCGIIAVNCFILISGYFRIKPSWKGFFNLYFQCAFYAIGFGILACLFHEGSWGQIIKSGFALSESNLWFVRTYFGLYLFAPLLNTAVNSFSARERLQMLVFLSIVDIYLGYMHQVEEIGISGYNLIHFIYLYYIGCYLSYEPAPPLKKYYGIIWVSFVITMTAMHAIKMIWPPVAVIYSLRYNSPMVLLASIVFFMWIRTWKIRSTVVNWIGASVFAVYLIHCNPFVWDRLMSFLKSIQADYTSWQTAILIPVALCGFYFICILVDKIRIVVFNQLIKRMTGLGTSIQKFLPARYR